MHWILDCGFFVSGTWTPDSRFLDSYSGFQRPGFRVSQQKYAAFRIPQGEISLIPETGFPVTWGEL